MPEIHLIIMPTLCCRQYYFPFTEKKTGFTKLNNLVRTQKQATEGGRFEARQPGSYTYNILIAITTLENKYLDLRL